MPQMVPMARALCRLLLPALLLTGCAHEAAKEQTDYNELLKRLPGQYDNRIQARSDPAHAAVLLSVTPADAITVGRVVVFVRETALDDPRRVLSQRIWTLELRKDKKTKTQQILQETYLFKDPQRWLHALDDPNVLQSLLPEDLTPLTGCELVWKKSSDGFDAELKAQTCEPGGAARTSLIELGAQLRGGELVLNEQQADSEGESAGAVFYDFRRRSMAAQKAPQP